ncbi:MAG: cell division protein FtsA [Candidatus Zixiibacteriota bacterium]|nr:MAG: cell division protein FtsA [candidate division Zixibacteria bacterium]
MARENIVAAVDIGTTKVVCLVGEIDKEDRIYVIGHGQSPAEGLRRGIVVDMEKAVSSIRKAVEDAQMTSGTEIDSVTVGIAGEHIRSINSHGVIAVARSDNEITAQDVKKAIDAARAVAIPVDREIIHVIPQDFSVDDQGGIKDPVGMTGVRLEVEAHIVTASVTSAKNIYRALERCHLNVDHIVLESVAVSDILLTGDETEMGVIVVDVGGDITGVAVFFDSAIRYTSVISLGGKNVTSDLAIGLRTTVDQAERLKVTYGAALASMVDPEEMITVTGAVGRSDKEVSRNVLASIIEPRMEEIFSLVLREIKKAGVADMPAAGIVLTGGGSLLAGTTELAEQIFDMPVRLGRIDRIEHVPEELDNVRYATAHGLLNYGFRHEPISGGGRGKFRGFLKRFESWITKRF